MSNVDKMKLRELAVQEAIAKEAEWKASFNKQLEEELRGAKSLAALVDVLVKRMSV